MPYPFIYHVISCNIISYHIISYQIRSDQIRSDHIIIPFTFPFPRAWVGLPPSGVIAFSKAPAARAWHIYIPNGWGHHHPSSPATFTTHLQHPEKASALILGTTSTVILSPKSGDFARLLGGINMDLSECGVDRCHRVWCQGPCASWRGSPDKPKPISAIFTFSTLGLVIPVSIILHHGIMKQWKPSNVAWANHCSYNSHHPTWLLLAVAGPHGNRVHW